MMPSLIAEDVFFTSANYTIGSLIECKLLTYIERHSLLVGKIILHIENESV